MFIMNFFFNIYFDSDGKMILNQWSETNKKWGKKQHKSSFYEFSVHNTDKFTKRDFTIRTFNCAV